MAGRSKRAKFFSGAWPPKESKRGRKKDPPHAWWRPTEKEELTKFGVKVLSVGECTRSIGTLGVNRRQKRLKTST